MLAALFETIAGLDARRAAQRFRRAVIEFALAGAAFLIGLGFLVAAAFLFALETFTPTQTALGFGLGFILLGGLVLLVDRTISRMRARRRAEEQRTDQVKSLATAAALAAIPALIRSGGVFGSLILPAAGALAYAIYRENARKAREQDLDEH